MRVLIISHNVFSKTVNMGKTLTAYFKGWPTEELAQLYIQPEVPTDFICHNYFRITDKDILKSILTRRSGTAYSKSDIRPELNHPRIQTGGFARFYRKGKKRTPLIYLARGLFWKFGKWKTKKLLDWVSAFKPDLVFYASGDYAFSYRIALEVAKFANAPLAVSCVDDFYFYNRNKNRFGGKFAHRLFMHQVKKTMSYASCIFTICPKMSADYSQYFNKRCYTLHTSASISPTRFYTDSNRIAYIGGLEPKRYEQLIKLGDALSKNDTPLLPRCVDVYSTEKKPHVLEKMCQAKGIHFCGELSADQVVEVMRNSMAIIHTESFDISIKQLVRYSVSTKIADSLASGTCILAFGPAEVASMEYLIENQAAYCITDDKELESQLLRFAKQAELREEITANAIRLAQENHNTQKNHAFLWEVLKNLCAPPLLTDTRKA